MQIKVFCDFLKALTLVFGFLIILKSLSKPLYLNIIIHINFYFSIYFFDKNLLNGNKDIINRIKAATIILGPDGVSHSRDVNKPIKTDIILTQIDKTIIEDGLLDIFLEAAAGKISKPVINKTPTIFKEIEITNAKSKTKIKFANSVFIPSALAISGFTVSAKSGLRMMYNNNNINIPPTHINNRSSLETAKISPNNKLNKSKRTHVIAASETKPTANIE